MNLLTSFFDHWEAGALEASPATDKLFYRVIAGHKVQFRKLDYKSRTSLAIEIAAVLKDLSSLVTTAFDLIAAQGQEIDEEQVIKAMLPQIIAALAVPGLQPLLNNLCGSASIDLGKGSFESLSDDIVGERVFGKDLTMQLPIAVSAALVNLDGIAPNMLNG